MTIKKTMKVKHTEGKPAPLSAAPGGATIADRFKLDTPPPVKTGGKGTVITFFAALISLAVSAVLTYMLWKHWEFLMPW